MAYERVPGRRVEFLKRDLLTPRDLSQIPDSRLADERKFWKGVVAERNDRLSLGLADLMIVDVLPRVRRPVDPLGFGLALTERGISLVATSANYSEFAVSGLALSQLAQRSSMLDVLSDEPDPEGAVFDLGLDMVVHAHRSRMPGLVPGFSEDDFGPNSPAAWYQDDVSVARVRRQADFSDGALAQFQADLGLDEQPDVSDFYAVRPRLTRAYLGEVPPAG